MADVLVTATHLLVCFLIYQFILKMHSSKNTVFIDIPQAYMIGYKNFPINEVVTAVLDQKIAAPFVFYKGSAEEASLKLSADFSRILSFLDAARILVEEFCRQCRFSAKVALFASGADLTNRVKEPTIPF